MAKRAFKTSGHPDLEAITTKIGEVTTLVQSYFSKFTKTTSGQQGMGEPSLLFAEDCDKAADQFPEVLSGTFNLKDFKVKLGGAQDFFFIMDILAAATLEWEKAAKICKADTMSYVSKIYAAFQAESEDDVKYLPTYQELKAFFKKTIAEKKAADNTLKTDNTATK